MVVLILSYPSCSGKKEIRIGVLLPLSGNTRTYGEAISKGVKLAAEEIKARGIKGFKGYTLTLIERDTKSDPEVGLDAMMDLLDRSGEDCFAILGPASSTVALRCAPIAKQRKRIMLTPAASEPEITKASNYVFRIYPSDLVEGRKMADFARKKLFIKKIVVIAEATDYAQGLKKVFVKSFREQAGDVALIVNVPDGATDVADYVTKAKELQPQGVYIVGYDHTIVRLLEEIHKQGVTDSQGKDARILSCGAFDSNFVFENACESAENTIFPRVAFSCETEGTEVKKFCDAFKAKYSQEPNTFAAHGYDALNLIIHAIEVQGGFYPEEMPLVLATTTNWKGVSGAVSFDGKGDVTSKFPKVYIVKQCKAMSFDELVDMLRQKEKEKWEELQRELEERRKALGQ